MLPVAWALQMFWLSGRLANGAEARHYVADRAA